MTFQAYGYVTLLMALAKAEGLTSEAGRNLLVTIPSEAPGAPPRVRTVPIQTLMSGADTSLNLPLHGGEEIRVPEAERVYVLGNVKKPGAFPVRDAAETSVLKVLALSEGLAPWATKEAYLPAGCEREQNRIRGAPGGHRGPQESGCGASRRGHFLRPG